MYANSVRTARNRRFPQQDDVRACMMGENIMKRIFDRDSVLTLLGSFALILVFGTMAWHSRGLPPSEQTAFDYAVGTTALIPSFFMFAMGVRRVVRNIRTVLKNDTDLEMIGEKQRSLILTTWAWTEVNVDLIAAGENRIPARLMRSRISALQSTLRSAPSLLICSKGEHEAHLDKWKKKIDELDLGNPKNK